MNVNQKEIVLIGYPFTDQKRKKVRPAVVISNNFFNRKSDDCILVPLTSVIKDEPFSILISQNDLIKGKLLKLSRIRVDKIFTIEKNLIIMKIGLLNNKIFQGIKSEIMKIF